MPRGAFHVSGCRWSWRRFFISLVAVFTVLSVALWWYSGRCPFTPEEMRFRLLMIQYVHTKGELDNLYMHATMNSASEFSANRKINSLCRSFEDFLIKYPSHDQAMNVYGTFLDEIGSGEKAVHWWERAVEFSRKNPQLLNNLANYYGHNGRAEDAIKLYEEAIKLDPAEPVYHFNLGNMYYLFRKETHQLHGWTLDQTFENSLVHFKQARQLAPRNSEYAISYAETYYGVKFLSRRFDWKEAESAWLYCLTLNHKKDYQDCIRVHLVRVNAYQGESLKALEWYGKIESPPSRQIAWQILKRFFPDEAGNEI